jgi:hypothetical protein
MKSMAHISLLERSLYYPSKLFWYKMGRNETRGRKEKRKKGGNIAGKKDI